MIYFFFLLMVERHCVDGYICQANKVSDGERIGIRKETLLWKNENEVF